LGVGLYQTDSTADKKEKLGIAVGLGVKCSSVAIIHSGDAERDLESFIKGNKK
jgi:ribosomal protein L7Ae-like RNA K-turn-binding protein